VSAPALPVLDPEGVARPGDQAPSPGDLPGLDALEEGVAAGFAQQRARVCSRGRARGGVR
jgi:hypothetical protein